MACPGIKVIQTHSYQLAPTYLIQSTWLDETINAVIAGLNSSVYVRDLTPRATHSRRGTTSKCAHVLKYSTAQDAQMCTDLEEGMMSAITIPFLPGRRKTVKRKKTSSSGSNKAKAASKGVKRKKRRGRRTKSRNKLVRLWFISVFYQQY